MVHIIYEIIKKSLKKNLFYPNNNDKQSNRYLQPVFSTRKHVFEIIDKRVDL